jgi:hypothetical protein
MSTAVDNVHSLQASTVSRLARYLLPHQFPLTHGELSPAPLPLAQRESVAAL